MQWRDQDFLAAPYRGLARISLNREGGGSAPEEAPAITLKGPQNIVEKKTSGAGGDCQNQTGQ